MSQARHPATAAGVQDPAPQNDSLEIAASAVVMARQRQVDEALRRAFQRSAPSAGKVSAEVDGDVVTVRHYDSVVLRWSLLRSAVLHEWHEKPTDKRVFAAAVAALESGEFVPVQARGAPPAVGAIVASSPAGPRKRKHAEVHPAVPMLVTREKHTLPRSHTPLTVIVGQSVTEKGSRFQAVVAFPVSDQAQAAAALTLLRQHSTLGGATHRITAFRAADGTDGCDDDGEDRGGSSLRAALRREGFTGVAACVARWYGGVNIGKARFTHIQDCAVRAFQAGGLVRGAGSGVVADVSWLQAGPGHKLGSAPAAPPGSGPSLHAPALAGGGGAETVPAAAAAMSRAAQAGAAVEKHGPRNLTQRQAAAQRTGTSPRGTGGGKQRGAVETTALAGTTMRTTDDRLARASLCAAAAEQRRQLARANRLAAAAGIAGIASPADGPLPIGSAAAAAAVHAALDELDSTALVKQAIKDQAASASTDQRVAAPSAKQSSATPRAQNGKDVARRPSASPDDEECEVIEIF